MYNSVNEQSIFLNLNVDGGRTTFSTSISAAMEAAETELATLNETIDSVKNLKPECDRLDYILAASSGAICGILDIFLVGKPKESYLGNVTDQWFADKTITFAKRCHPNKEIKDLSAAIRELGKTFKVPYDQRGAGDAGKIIYGLTPTNHHFKSLAHNPSLLGLFFSILDQFDNTSHFVSDGQIISLQKANEEWELQGGNIPGKLFCGFTNWFKHIVSDVSGSETSAKAGNRGMGIPSPLWTWTNDLIAIKSKLGINVTDIDKAINDLALNIFNKGYDFRFQSTQTIPVILNELIVRFIYAIRRLFKYLSGTPHQEREFSLMWKNCEPFSNPTVKRMLTVAHGTFCLIDIGDAVGQATINGGGTFNVVEFVLRLNIVGVGRFTISLYGETKRAFQYKNTKEKGVFAAKERVIVDNYIEGLKILSLKYDDENLLKFTEDLKKSDAYLQAFEKTVELAELRNVQATKILRSKSDIDKYFRG